MYSALRLLQNLPTRYLSYRYVNLVRETAEVERRLYVFFVAATPLKIIATSACTFTWILLSILPWKLVLDILRKKKRIITVIGYGKVTNYPFREVPLF